jgi:hypothetical protein
MNLTDIKPTQTALQFANSMQNTFGVTVDISKLDLDKSAKLLISVNEQIQKQRLSEDRHKLHTTKSYLAKIFIKENLEKHIAELDEALKIAYKDKKWDKIAAAVDKQDDESAFEPGGAADNEPIPNSTAKKRSGMKEEKEKAPAIDTRPGKWLDPRGYSGPPRKMPDHIRDHIRKRKEELQKNPGKLLPSGWPARWKNPLDVTEEKLTEKHDEQFVFDPKGFVALRKLVGSENMMRAKRAIEMAHQGKAVPAMFVKSFLPLIDMLDDIMMSGMANVQMLKNLTKRARKQLGVDESVEQVSDRLRGLYESQEDQAELLLASKDVVDRVQKAVDDLSKLRNEDLPPLLDAMRDEVGSEISTAYANIVVPTLDQLVDANQMARETLSTASRIITGEEQAPQAMGAEMPVEEVPMDAEPMPEEDFETADVAAGAEEEIGRAERE